MPNKQRRSKVKRVNNRKSYRSGGPVRTSLGTNGSQLSNGNFHDYPGLVELNKQSIFDNLQMQIDHGKFTEFIKDTVAGGDTFSSTDVYIKSLKKIINENNL